MEILPKNGDNHNVKDYIQNTIVNVHSYKTSWLKMIVVFLFVANTSSVDVGVMFVRFVMVVQWVEWTLEL